MRLSKAEIDIDDRKDDLMDLLESDRAGARAFWEKLDLSWTYHECALEGVVILPEEMAQAFRPAPPVSEIGKAQFLADIRRQREAIDAAKEEATVPKVKITLNLVKKLYETLSGGEQGKGKMEFRKDMPLHRTYFHDIAQPPKIAPDLTKLVEWTATPEFGNLHPLQQAAQFHHRFMSIFPFSDSMSGRVGRLLMNILVMRAGYLPAVIHAIDRQRYYDSLKQQPRLLQSLVTEAIEHATEHGFKFFGAPLPQRSWEIGNS
jgi:hypothetical protein